MQLFPVLSHTFFQQFGDFQFFVFRKNIYMFRLEMKVKSRICGKNLFAEAQKDFILAVVQAGG